MMFFYFYKKLNIPNIFNTIIDNRILINAWNMNKIEKDTK